MYALPLPAARETLCCLIITVITHNALEDISKCLIPFDEDATIENLQSELCSLALHWDTIKKSPLSEYTTRESQSLTSEEEEDNQEDMEEIDLVSKRCTACRNCAVCCYFLLQQLKFFSHAYHKIQLAYKFFLTLSCTQVACERSFSTLKFIKSRLRSRMREENLEAFMLMATEEEILMRLDSDDVIDRVAEKSKLLRNLLL